VRESQKVEGSRPTEPALAAVLCRLLAELDEARFIRMEFQPKLPQSFP